MQQQEKEEEEREEEEGWRSSRKRRRSSERRHHVHPSLSASAAPWRRQHRPHRIPQGYKNSPTIFGEQLAKDLESWEPPPGKGQLLQYVDDLLRATRTQETCVDCTVSLLNFLGLQGYRVSEKKAQIVRQTIIYLGYNVSAGQRTLGQDRKEAVYQTLKPQTVKELRTFLGMTGWYRLWIYNYGLLIKPLYDLIMEGSRDLQWTKEATRAFDQLKKALMSAPALGLPDVSNPFFLFSHKKQGIALGISAQNLGPYQRAVAYLSKQLDTAAKGWPSGSTGEPVIHECLETIEATYSSRQDLKDTPLEDAETCLLMEAAMSSVEEDMLGMQLPQARRLKIEGCVIRGYDIDFNITQGCTEFHKNQTKITPPVPRKAVITQIPTIPEVEEQITPVVTKIKPKAIKKTGVQKLVQN
ncbi:hypothetical protein DUI87_06182 [Hirundo rustica rustica]|uniref:ribonuclease H n=1 Tax=Hirundo rustica rustica TaxID=333673 RepID=A0A3M0LCT6_HIRRU|nr:hypothetical protein DUI87_06182 [Hirundo rustica rustica]